MLFPFPDYCEQNINGQGRANISVVRHRDLRYMPKSGVAGSFSRSIFSFSRKLLLISIVAVPVCSSMSSACSFPLPTYSATSAVICCYFLLFSPYRPFWLGKYQLLQKTFSNESSVSRKYMVKEFLVKAFLISLYRASTTQQSKNKQYVHICIYPFQTVGIHM